jgi:protein-tyrosine phosphatase
MAEALLRFRLTAREVPDVHVHSAGVMDGGAKATADTIATLADRGVDLSRHRSRQMTPELLQSADLIVAMARVHVREAVLLLQDVWPRTFTLKDLVRRGEMAGWRMPDQPLDEWLAKVHAGRTPHNMVGTSGEDDVADPIGRNAAFYRKTAEEIDDLVRRMGTLIWGTR